MNCDLKNRTDLIEKYLLNELPSAEMKEFEEHFLDCDECFEELQSTSQLTQFIKDEGNLLFKEYIKQSERDSPFSLIEYIKGFFIPEWSLKPALTYAFMAVFSGLIIITMFNSPKTPGPDGSARIERLAELQKQFPAMFSKAADLENLISQEYRSDAALEVTAPKNGNIFTDDVSFKWNTNSGVNLKLKVLDNNENVVAEKDNPGGSYLLETAKLNLSTGLYYWKLESPDELLYVGKFYLDLNH